MIRKRFEDVYLPYGLARYGHTDRWYFFNRDYSPVGGIGQIVYEDDCVEVDLPLMYKRIDKLAPYIEPMATEGGEYYKILFNPSDDGVEYISHYFKTLRHIFNKRNIYSKGDINGVNGYRLAAQYLPYFFAVKDGQVAASNREYNALSKDPYGDGQGKQRFNWYRCNDEFLSLLEKYFPNPIEHTKGLFFYFLYSNREKCLPEMYSRGYFSLLQDFTTEVVEKRIYFEK